MGHDLAKPHRPWAALVLACSTPSLFLSFLRILERRAARVSPAFGRQFAIFLKAYGPPFFVAGHFIMCNKKPKKDAPDWCYINATICLSLAGQATYWGRKLPVAILFHGLFLFFFGTLNFGRARAAQASTLLANLATAAGVSNTCLGTVLLSLEAGRIKETPFALTLPQHAQLTSSLFGAANYLKLLQLIQSGATQDNIFLGQFLKCIASTSLLAGNGLVLGWQRLHVPGESTWNAAGLMALGALAMPYKRALET